MSNTGSRGYYCFIQNNSGGSFQTTTGIEVVVEAHSPEDANNRAENVGVYFDGASGEDGADCPCCGDRWSRISDWDEPDAVPTMSYDQDVSSGYIQGGFGASDLEEGEPYGYIYYLDGSSKEVYPAAVVTTTNN